MPSYRCRYPLCAALVPADAYCPTHEHVGKEKQAERHREYDQTHRDRESKAFYNSADWRRLRKQQLALNPLCENCCRKWATTVHHRVAIKADPSRRLDLDNLLALCKPCHDSIEARQRGSDRET